MVSAGGRRIKTIVALGGVDALEACTPCGGCRQRIAEFADQDTDIVLMGEAGELVHYTMDALLPVSFTWPESS
jgi:cytidine deaminase